LLGKRALFQVQALPRGSPAKIEILQSDDLQWRR
jgi:hypothetical protein